MATREEIELIRERIDMIEVLSRYVALKRSGKSYVAICPFHADNHPSLVVDPERKLFHCFGCGEGGDIFKFLMKIEHLDFGEAVERLAQETGVELSHGGPSKGNELRELNERIARYFEENLRSPAGTAARRYLAERGITPEMIKRFRLGYALPGWDNLLKKFGRTEELVQLGLVVQGRSGYYDRFRDRIIFPLCDPGGRVIGFSGRIFRGQEGEPKYLNISNTPLFKKGEVIFGLHLARQGNPKELILVEGYTDVIALHQAGVDHAIATMGTALTDSQARLLRRYVERVVLAYDRDAAGQAAALRGAQALRNVGLDLQVALLPAGEDPDSLIRSRGVEAFQEILDAALPFHRFYVAHLAEKAHGKGRDPLQIERILHEAGAFIEGIASRPLRHELIRGLSEAFNLPEEEIELELRRRQGRSQRVRRQGDNGDDGRPLWGPEEHLLYFLLQGDLPLEQAVRELKPEDFPRYRGIIEEIFAQASQGPLKPEQLLENLDEADQRAVTALALSQVEFRDRERAIRDAIIALKLPRLEGEWAELRKRLSEAEERGDRAEAQRLLREQGRLRQELLRLKKGR
jgi:DNA primase